MPGDNFMSETFASGAYLEASALGATPLAEQKLVGYSNTRVENFMTQSTPGMENSGKLAR
jgi:hypothetical protein